MSQTLNDLSLEYGEDLVLTASGSFAVASGETRVRQRIVRDIFTAAALTLPDGSTTSPGYVFHPNYGQSAGYLIGQQPTRAYYVELEKRIATAVVSDASVDPSVAPVVTFANPAPSVLQVTVTLQLLSTGEPTQIEIELPA